MSSLLVVDAHSLRKAANLVPGRPSIRYDALLAIVHSLQARIGMRPAERAILCCAKRLKNNAAEHGRRAERERFGAEANDVFMRRMVAAGYLVDETQDTFCKYSIGSPVPDCGLAARISWILGSIADREGAPPSAEVVVVSGDYTLVPTLLGLKERSKRCVLVFPDAWKDQRLARHCSENPGSGQLEFHSLDEESLFVQK